MLNAGDWEVHRVPRQKTCDFLLGHPQSLDMLERYRLGQRRS
jgi:hypothetical protein